MLLDGKIIMVTGIGPGMGSQTARMAALEGAAGVVLASRNPDNMDRSEAEIREANSATKVLKLALDIQDRDGCNAAIAAVEQQFNRLDALINNAFAHHGFSPIDQSNFTEWQSDINVNLFGSMHISMAAVELMKKQSAGAIVMVNTMAARRPHSGESSYAVSKGALKTAAGYMALELGQYGIRVNTIAPGWMWGPSVQGYLQMAADQGMGTVEELKKNVETEMALGKMPTDEECARVVLFLASDYSCAMTGACLDVNGGHFFTP